MMNAMYGINLVVRHCDTAVVGLSPALGLIDGSIGWHHAMHDVIDRRSFAAELCLYRYCLPQRGNINNIVQRTMQDAPTIYNCPPRRGIGQTKSMMNDTYELNPKVHHFDSALVRPPPALGLPEFGRLAIIARCTMLLTSTPLELIHV